MGILQWVGFIVFVLAMLALDLGILRRDSRIITASEALRWTAFCIATALAFNVYVYFMYSGKWGGLNSNLSGAEAAQQFFTAWLVEQSLSLDNVFVFALVFNYFSIPLQYQHRVLFWGIIGALLMRGLMIAIGAALLQTFTWTEYVFGGLLLYAALRMLLISDERYDPSRSLLFRTARRLYPVTEDLHGEKFFLRLADGRKAITPLFLVLLVIEGTDVLFAVDSIPAVFAVTSDPFIVFTSNIFAILNLRSLYFGLSSLIVKFHKLKLFLVLILVFVAFKMLSSHYIHISTTVSLITICSLLALGILTSIFSPKSHASKSHPLTPDL